MAVGDLGASLLPNSPGNPCESLRVCAAHHWLQKGVEPFPPGVSIRGVRGTCAAGQIFASPVIGFINDTWLKKIKMHR